MNQVTMRHPDLADQITVPESAVPIHMASGWVPVDEKAVETEGPTQPAATSKPKAPAPAKDKE